MFGTCLYSCLLILLRIRWLFEKRDTVSSWAEAVRAFNGDGTDATNYKNNVIKRRDKAKAAS